MNYKDYVEWKEADPEGASMWAGQNNLPLMLMWMIEEWGDTTALKLYAKVMGWSKPFVGFARAMLQTMVYENGENEAGEIDASAMRKIIEAGEPSA